MVYCDNQGETDYLVTEERYVWNIDLIECHLELSCPLSNVNGKLQQPNPGKTTNEPDPSGIKNQVTTSSKDLCPAEVLMEFKGRSIDGGRNLLQIPAMTILPITKTKNYNCYEYFSLFCVYTHI